MRREPTPALRRERGGTRRPVDPQAVCLTGFAAEPTLGRGPAICDAGRGRGGGQPSRARDGRRGDDQDWGFALHDPATQTYTAALLRTGQPTGHPSEAFDTAAYPARRLPTVTITHPYSQCGTYERLR